MVGKDSFSMCEEPMIPLCWVVDYLMLGSAKQDLPNSGYMRVT